MPTMRSSGRRMTGRVAWRRRAARKLRRSSALLALAAVALLAGAALLYAQHSSNGTSSLALDVSPAVQLTGDSTSVSLWIRVPTSGTGYLWGDSASTCTSPIGTATTYTSGKYNNIPLTNVHFTASNNYVCAYDPGAAIPSAFVAWPHTGLHLVFGTQPSTTASGVAISPPGVTVQVQDSNGIVVTSSTASVAIAITSGTGTSGATLSGTTPVNAVAGVATFNNLSIDKVGTGYTLTATSSGLSSATSSTFNIVPGNLASFVFTLASPQANGVAFTGTNTLTAKDTAGNTITNFDASANNVTITANSPLTGAVSGIHGSNVLNLAGDFTNGVANLTALGMKYTGNAVIGSFTATSATGKTGLSGSVTINAGAATKLAYTTVPSTGTAGTAFSVTVQSQDASGNPASPTSNTTIQLSKATGGGSLSGTLTGTIPTSGNSVTISTPVYSKADTMTLTATATVGQTSLTAVTSGNIVFSAGTATKLAINTPAGCTASLDSCTTNPRVTVQDANGNTVTSGTGSNASITLGAINCTGAEAFGYLEANPHAASSGIATFTVNSISKSGRSGCTITTTSSPAYTPATTGTFSVQ